MGVPETIRIFEFTMVLITSKKHFQILLYFFLFTIQSICSFSELNIKHTKCAHKGDFLKFGHKYVTFANKIFLLPVAVTIGTGFWKINRFVTLDISNISS